MKLKSVKEFTIDVNNRCRGGVNGSPMLLNYMGKQCCLGFHCEAMGVPKNDLFGKFMPRALNKIVPLLTFIVDDTTPHKFFSTTFACEASDINDDQGISLFERIKKLRALYKANGIRVRFKNIPKNAKNLK